MAVKSDWLLVNGYRLTAWRPLSILSILTAFLLFFSNCQEPTEDCLDVRATNFNVAAGKACVSCCTYPSLTLKMNYLSDTSSFVFDSTYTNSIGQKFRVLGAQMYLSDFQLFTSDGKAYAPTDSVSLYRQTDTVKTLNNYALVGRNNGFDFTVGAFGDAIGKTFTKVKFQIGLSDTANLTDPKKMPPSSPLSTKADSMYLTPAKTYIFNKLIVAKGVGFKDTLRLNIATAQTVQVAGSIPTVEGINAVIKLKINYLRLFDGVNFTDGETVIKGKIVANYGTTFSIQ